VRNDGERIVLFGAGGHAKIVLATIEAEGRYTVVGLLDDDVAKHGTTFYGYPVLGGREQLPQLRAQGITEAFVSVGADRVRGELAQLLTVHGFRLARVVHPTATVLRGAHIGPGTAVLINAFVGADARVAENAILNVGAVVSHDCIVGSCVQMGPLASLGGNSRVGDYTFIGMKGTVLQGLTVGRDVRIGANAVVIESLPDGVTAVGVPARIVRRRAG